MQTNAVSFSVLDQGNESILADAGFLSNHMSAFLPCTGERGFNVGRRKVNQDTFKRRFIPFRFDEAAGCRF